MLPRAALRLVLAATVLCLLDATPVSARGTPVRGMKINRSMSVSASTGNCKCVWEWFTVGLNPGTFTVATQIRACQIAMAPTCGMYIDLFRGETKLTGAQGSCDSPRRSCRETFSLSYRVTQRGVYYLLIHGVGAQTVNYRMRVRGNIYPLACRASC